MRIRKISVAILMAVTVANVSASADRGLKATGILNGDAGIPQYHALIIGINEYRHWPSLLQARQDAEKVAYLLKTSYGFGDIRALYDREGTRKRILGELRRCALRLGANDALLIYFSGHGYYDKPLQNGYWVPAGAAEREQGQPATAEWIPDVVIRDLLDKMQVRHVLVVSDSCFSGALLRGGPGQIERKENTWYRRAIRQPSRWCLASGDLETVPDQSVFAKKFLQVLQFPRQSVFSGSDVAGWIKKDVAALTGRQPVFGPLKTASGSDVGEFVFVARQGTQGLDAEIQRKSADVARLQEQAEKERRAEEAKEQRERIAKQQELARLDSQLKKLHGKRPSSASVKPAVFRGPGKCSPTVMVHSTLSRGANLKFVVKKRYGGGKWPSMVAYNLVLQTDRRRDDEAKLQTLRVNLQPVTRRDYYSEQARVLAGEWRGHPDGNAYVKEYTCHGREALFVFPAGTVDDSQIRELTEGLVRKQQSLEQKLKLKEVTENECCRQVEKARAEVLRKATALME